MTMKQFPNSIAELACLPFASHTNARVLAAGVAERFDVPAGARYVVFSSNDDFYAKENATATIPVDTTDGSASELNPTMRSLFGTEYISVISEGAPIVTASFFS